MCVFFQFFKQFFSKNYRGSQVKLVSYSDEKRCMPSSFDSQQILSLLSFFPILSRKKKSKIIFYVDVISIGFCFLLNVLSKYAYESVQTTNRTTDGMTLSLFIPISFFSFLYYSFVLCDNTLTDGCRLFPLPHDFMSPFSQ